MRSPPWLPLLLMLVLTPFVGATSDDPNAAVRQALQRELEDFGLPGWQARPAPKVGPALEGYRARLIKVADVPDWAPRFRAGTIPLVSGVAQETLGVTVYEPEGPPQGTLLFVHGYMSHAANFAYTFASFTKQGWMVVTLDLPGHGLSTGRRADVASFEVYGDAVATWLRWVETLNCPSPRVLLAHSLGSAACFEALRRPSTPRPDRIVFCAPLLRVDWHPALEFGEKTLGWWLKKMPSTFGWDGYLDGYTMPVHWFQVLDEWLDGLRNQEPPRDLVVTIYSGDRDTVVDEDWNRAEYRRLLPQVRYVTLPGKGHLFLTSKRDRAAFQEMLLASLP